MIRLKDRDQFGPYLPWFIPGIVLVASTFVWMKIADKFAINRALSITAMFFILVAAFICCLFSILKPKLYTPKFITKWKKRRKIRKAEKALKSATPQMRFELADFFQEHGRRTMRFLAEPPAIIKSMCKLGLLERCNVFRWDYWINKEVVKILEKNPIIEEDEYEYEELL